MKPISLLFLTLSAFCLSGCFGPKKTNMTGSNQAPFLWENANIYFLLTDRFNNGDRSNDLTLNRTNTPAKLRGFLGGDLKGITQKIEEGYFDKLGITAIWFTPVVEQIHDSIDEGTGNSYGFHGYWAKDWTSLDPNFGTESDLAALVETAHQHGIRILLDVVINHTGPVTGQDPVWPDGWVRTSPLCTYKNYATTTACTLVKNLPDIRTESNAEVDIPPFLKEKWQREGRLDREMAELDAFFQRTGYPRSPRHYIIKWLTDYIRKFGVDGFRCDTVKHLEESAWSELRKEADAAFNDWKKANPKKLLDHQPFYLVGEVYGYGISGGRNYDFGDRKVDYFNHGFTSLINFEFKSDANNNYESLFSKYSNHLKNALKGQSVVNYLSSHDDGSPFDKQRKQPVEAGTKLLLCPGASQVYYGDETCRSLDIPGTNGDATLRSFMNWEELTRNNAVNGYPVNEVLAHWQKLGTFRKAHPAVGAGVHEKVASKPYLFKRTYQSDSYEDKVVVGLGLEKGKKDIPVKGIFEDGAVLKDYYSGQTLKVVAGRVSLDSGYDIVLLGK
jgi:alpha-amylase